VLEPAGGRNFQDVDNAGHGKSPECGQDGIRRIVKQQDGEQKAGDFVSDEGLAVFLVVIGLRPAAEGDGDRAPGEQRDGDQHGLQRLIRYGERERDVDCRTEQRAASARHDRRAAEAEARRDHRPNIKSREQGFRFWFLDFRAGDPQSLKPKA